MGLEDTVAIVFSRCLGRGLKGLITTILSADLGTHKRLKGNSHAVSGSVGAAQSPLLAGVISLSERSNLLYGLMFAYACALLFLICFIYKKLSCPGLVVGDQALLFCGGSS